MRARRARNVAPGPVRRLNVMMRGLRALVLIAAAGMVLAACTLNPNGQGARDALINQIADDAVAFNDAYAHAVNAQILLNILRARDRQPRYYLSTTGISDAPFISDDRTLGLSGIGLGNGFANWAIGSGSLHRETSRRPSYAVQPLGADTLAKAVFQPTPHNVFLHYWNSGWPRDMLVLLLVDKITRVEGGRAFSFDNEANNVSADCVSAVQTSGCAFVREARTLIGAMNQSAAPLPPNAPCGLIEAYSPVISIPSRPPVAGEACATQFIVGGATYTLSLRSFDDIVYYVGELMRLSYTRGDAVLEAPLNVSVAGLRGGGQGAPLFRILPQGAANEAARGKPRQDFAASVQYAGQRYFAGQAVGRACADAAPDGLCKDDASNGDRSSSVLSLLAELLALNQSPDSIRAPGRVFTE
jgi:hypothetical protein